MQILNLRQPICLKCSNLSIIDCKGIKENATSQQQFLNKFNNSLIFFPSI